MRKLTFLLKSGFVIIAAFLMLQLMPLSASATATSANWHGFNFSGLDNGTKIQITSYVGTETDIGIPSNIYGTPVTKVNLIGILHYESLRSVSIPDTVTEIVTGSLSNCPNLIAVNFLGNAPRITGGSTIINGVSSTCFANNASGFKIYYLPGKTGFTNPWCGQTTEVASAPLTDNAYYWAPGSLLYKIRPDNSAMIMGSSYYEHDAENLVIPAMVDGHPVRKIAPGAFKNQYHIKKVTLPDGLTSIGAYAFKFCSVEDITLPNSLTRIEEGAFYHSALDRVSIPRQVNYIGNDAFLQSYNLIVVKFFGNAPEMGSEVFADCSDDLKIYNYPGTTGYSNPWQGYPVEPMPIVPTGGSQQQAAVFSLQAQANLGTVRLDWNSFTDSRGVSGYNVYRSTSPGTQPNTPLASNNNTTITYIDPNVQMGMTYYYIVKPVFADNSLGTASNEVSATVPGILGGNTGSMIFTIGNPLMSGNGVQKEIDAGFGTAPEIIDGRTFLPIRALITEMGGSIEWDANERKVTTFYDGKMAELWIGSKNVRVNGVSKTTDAAPYISASGRTMLPLRFIGESLGCEVSWDSITKSAAISYGIGDTPKIQNEANVPAAVSVLPTGVPGSIPAPVIANLQSLRDDSEVPYFRFEVAIPDSVRTLDQVRPADGWVDMEIYTQVDNEDWSPDGGGLEVFMQEPVPGKSGVYYITVSTFDEGGLGETLINARQYTFKTRFYYTYPAEDDDKYVYSAWSNTLSGQSASYYRSDEE